jgi:hypothetical protein
MISMFKRFVATNPVADMPLNEGQHPRGDVERHH